jgi:DNA-binding transcriptional MerR regulator
MLSIGEFARRGRVSVRMLRHYDALGLLRPATVNASTGYRAYEARQLVTLNRVVALKDLGFALAEVKSIVEGDLGIAELRGMFRLRRSQLQAGIEAERARLASVDARLRFLESASALAGAEVALKAVPAQRVAQLCGTAVGFEPAAIAPVLGPLFRQLIDTLAAASIPIVGPVLALYEESPDGDALQVRAAMPIGSAHLPDDCPLATAELPPLELAASVLHHGPMDDVMLTLEQLGRWIDASPYRSAGYNREVYLHCGPDRSHWVVELQEPLRPAETATQGA